MKRFLTTSFLLLFCASITACDGEDQDNAQTADRQNNPPAVVASAPDDLDIEALEDESLLKFEYTAPENVLDLPDLRKWMADDRRAALTDHMKEAEKQRDQRLSSGHPFTPHEFEKHWTVTANTPTLYSIVADVYVFKGGAHGNSSFDVLIWSYAENKFMLTQQIFEKPLEFMELIRPVYCEELNKLRRGKRGISVDTLLGDNFNDCPAMGQFQMAPVAANDTVTGFNIYIPDNAVGPHSEGTYTVHIPVTNDIKNMLRAPYVSDF